MKIRKYYVNFAQRYFYNYPNKMANEKVEVITIKVVKAVANKAAIDSYPPRCLRKLILQIGENSNSSV